MGGVAEATVADVPVLIRPVRPGLVAEGAAEAVLVAPPVLALRVPMGVPVLGVPAVVGYRLVAGLPAVTPVLAVAVPVVRAMAVPLAMTERAVPEAEDAVVAVPLILY